MRYLIKPREFLSFFIKMGKNISKTLNNKYNQNLLYLAKLFATDVSKTFSKKEIQNTLSNW